MLDYREHGRTPSRRTPSGRIYSGCRTPSGRQIFCGSGKELWTEKAGVWFEALTPTKPQIAYKSPLQRIGETLREPLMGPSSPLALNTDMRKPLLSPTPRTSPEPQSGRLSPAREHLNCSYKLLPGGNSTPTSPLQLDLTQDVTGCSGRTSDGLEDIRTFRKDGYFTGISLLSSLFSSNPRTRAPFKPQKSNRGTSTWQLKQYAEATLGSGSLRKAVKLPEGEDKDEWLAVNGELHLYFGMG
jgi:MOB kinase activator 1